MCAIIGGVALVAWGAPSHTETHRGWPAVVGVVAALSLAGIVPFLVRGSRLDTGMMIVDRLRLRLGGDERRDQAPRRRLRRRPLLEAPSPGRSSGSRTGRSRRSPT